MLLPGGVCFAVHVFRGWVPADGARGGGRFSGGGEGTLAPPGGGEGSGVSGTLGPDGVALA